MTFVRSGLFTTHVVYYETQMRFGYGSLIGFSRLSNWFARADAPGKLPAHVCYRVHNLAGQLSSVPLGLLKKFCIDGCIEHLNILVALFSDKQWNRSTILVG